MTTQLEVIYDTYRILQLAVINLHIKFEVGLLILKVQLQQMWCRTVPHLTVLSCVCVAQIVTFTLDALHYGVTW